MKLAALAYGAADALQWGSRERAVDFYDLKGDLESLLAPRALTFSTPRLIDDGPAHDVLHSRLVSGFLPEGTQLRQHQRT